MKKDERKRGGGRRRRGDSFEAETQAGARANLVGLLLPQPALTGTEYSIIYYIL
jgi:hypothetical protein